MEPIPEVDEDEDKTNETGCFYLLTEIIKKMFMFKSNTKYIQLIS